MENFLKAFQGQSHRTGQRHSFHFSAIGNEPEAKGLPPEGECLLMVRTLTGGEMFFYTFLCHPEGLPKGLGTIHT